MQTFHEFGLLFDPFSIFFNNLESISILAYAELVTPFTGSANINIILSLFAMDNSHVTINTNMKLKHIITERATVTQGATGKELDYLQDAADLLTKHLGLGDQSITISFDPPVDLDNSQTGVTVGIGRPPNKIFVMVDKNLSVGEKLLTLAHEMVHVKQLASGRLVFDKLENGKVSGEWEGEKFDEVKYSRNNPWEIEAHTKDKELRSFILKELGNFTA